MTIVPPVCPLFVPASRPDRFKRAAESGAGAIVIDLEDSVAPAGKDAARATVRENQVTELPVLIRINGAGTPWHDDDLQSVKALPIAGIVLPKAEKPEDIAAVRQKLGRDIAVYPLIESARGMESRQLVLSAEGVTCAVFGSLDYALDMNCVADWTPLLPARMALVQTSRSLGLAAPIDGVTVDFQDGARTSQDAKLARDHGFGGKLAIHPTQVEPILAAFRPDEEQVAWARRILDAAAATDSAVCVVDGAMVDAPVIGKAQDIMRRAS